MDISSLTPDKQVKLQYWLDVIRQCRASGLTNQAWCEQNQISLKSYYVTRHFIVDEKSILFSTVSTPLRHLHFADRTLLSTKLCSQIKIFRLELCVQ